MNVSNAIEAYTSEVSVKFICAIIDDSLGLAEEEIAICRRFGGHVMTISSANVLLDQIQAVFDTARQMRIRGRNILFLVDNRIRSFSVYFSGDGIDENVITLKQFQNQFGANGKHMGMAISEWLYSEFKRRVGDFNVAVLSAFGDEGIKLRINRLQAAESGFRGLYRKIASDEGSQEQSRLAFVNLVEEISDPHERDVDEGSDDAYPYQETLVRIIDDLECGPQELGELLRLSDRTDTNLQEKLRQLRDPAVRFELDTTDWQEKTFAIMDILFQLEHDLRTLDKVRSWLRQPNDLVEGLVPREIILSGSGAAIGRLRRAIYFFL